MDSKISAPAQVAAPTEHLHIPGAAGPLGDPEVLAAPAVPAGEALSREYDYALSVAEAIWRKHYQPDAPHWRPFPDLLSLLTQIDNMTAGLTRRALYAAPVAQAAPAQVAAPDEREAFEAYSRSKPHGGFTLDRYKDPECTQYVHYNTQWAWEAWQARAAAAHQGSAPTAGAPVQPVPGTVAYEFHHPNGHAIVDYSVHTHVGPLTPEKGYVAKPLVYASERDRWADEAMKWRKKYAELRYPGMTREVKANAVESPAPVQPKGNDK
jgi:hypothetical protein